MLISIGLDHRGSSVELRERLHGLSTHAVDRPRRPLLEIASFATCNRVELYGWVDPHFHGDIRRAFDALVGSLTRDHRERRDLLSMGVRRLHRDVAVHLFRVACGLESQVLGDIHVIGQLKRAFQTAQERDGVGAHLHRLFEFSLQAGKKVRSATPLMAGRHSVGSEAAAYALRTFGEPAPGHRLRCLVVGCGKVGSHAAAAFGRHDVDLAVTNRSFDKAQQVAQEVGARAVPWTGLYDAIAQADAVVVATGAPCAVIEPQELSAALARQCWNPVADRLIIDIAMPRNVAPPVGALEGVRLINLDAMHPEVAEVERARCSAVPQAEAIVDERVDSFMEWVAMTNANEALRPLREVLEQICRRELEYATDDSVAQRTADRIVAKVLSTPMRALRASGMADEELGGVALTIQSLFGEEASTSGGTELRR